MRDKGLGRAEVLEGFRGKGDRERGWVVVLERIPRSGLELDNERELRKLNSSLCTLDWLTRV